MSNYDSQGKSYGNLMFCQNQIWPVFVSCNQDQTKRESAPFFLLQIHWSHFSTPKPYTICPVLIAKAKVMATSCFAKTIFGRFLYCATRTNPRDSAIFLSTDFLDLIFQPQKHIQYFQFWQLGQKLWQFQVLPKPVLADFCVVQQGPNQETVLFLLALIS